MKQEEDKPETNVEEDCQAGSAPSVAFRPAERVGNGSGKGPKRAEGGPP